MPLGQEIIVVSGLPRSGTSLMMQMLKSAGIDVLTDSIRSPDADNPLGYFEYELVKEIAHDQSWLPAARGKAVKMISLLLYHLPATESYKILFLERDLEEVLQSQEAMLRRLNRPVAPHDQMLASLQTHLDSLHGWLTRQTHMQVLRVEHRNLIQEPTIQAQRVSDFLNVWLDERKMSEAVDPTLYRNRHRQQ